jgi:hypothetical protein
VVLLGVTYRLISGKGHSLDVPLGNNCKFKVCRRATDNIYDLGVTESTYNVRKATGYYQGLVVNCINCSDTLGKVAEWVLGQQVSETA